MSTPRRRSTAGDPAAAANERILADRQQRIDDKAAVETLATDLGLDIKTPESRADNATDFLSDEWDRKAFGDAIPTYSRIVYGPDPLLVSCPAMKASIENIGLEKYANATAEAMLLKEDRAVSDPIMQKGLRAAIAKFGVVAVAASFRERILKIPQRTVEVEADRTDVMVYSRPMEDAVIRYGTPGMAPKFLSDRCIGVLGMRGYRVVKNEHGEPVKVGTLIMGEIPLRWAEDRRRKAADDSNQAVRDAAEAFEDTAARAIRDGGKSGISVLSQGDRVSSNAAGDFEDAELTASYLGKNRETGFSVERQK